MRHRLHTGQHMHPRTFQRIGRTPADARRRALHEQEGLFFERPHHAVVCRAFYRCRDFILLFVPVRVIVPGYDVKPPLHPVIIKSLEKVHEVRGCRQVRSFFYRADLRLAEITDLFRGEPPPVQDKRRARRLAVRPRAVDLVPVRIRMAPELVPPGIIKLIQRSVFLLQPFAEGLLAQFAVACRIAEIAAQLIGNMPQDHILPAAEPFGQFPVNSRDLLTHHRRGIAEIVAFARQIPVSVRLHLHHFRIFLRQPVGHGPGRRRQDHADPFLFKPCNDMIQPVHLIAALFRLQRGPGENAQAHAVHAGLFHEPNVFLEYFRISQPLVRIVVSSVEQSSS